MIESANRNRTACVFQVDCSDVLMLFQQDDGFIICACLHARYCVFSTYEWKQLCLQWRGLLLTTEWASFYWSELLLNSIFCGIRIIESGTKLAFITTTFIITTLLTTDSKKKQEIPFNSFSLLIWVSLLWLYLLF